MSLELMARQAMEKVAALEIRVETLEQFIKLQLDLNKEFDAQLRQGGK